MIACRRSSSTSAGCMRRRALCPLSTILTWYISRDNQRVGPFSADEFARFEKAGTLRPTDQVWQTGMDAWIEYRAPRKIALGKAARI